VSDEILTFARQLSRTEFIAKCPHPMLLSSNAASAETPAMGNKVDWTQYTMAGMDAAKLMKAAMEVPSVLELKKIQKLFGNMITIGRALNNDVVIADSSISKFHAYFQGLESPDTIKLADAGSTNGTWAEDEKLVPRAEPVPVKLGARVRFGNLLFNVYDAGGLWDRLRKGLR
jgi:hypothetical protein